MSGSTKGDRRIEWRIEGSDVIDGTAPVDQVVRLLENLQRAVRVLAERPDDSSHPRRRGPPKREVAQVATLRLVKISKGSFQATLELPKPEPQARMFDVGEDALNRLMDALRSAADGDIAVVPEVIRPEIKAMTRLVGNGIDSIEFKGPGKRRRSARFEAPVEEPKFLEYVERRASISGRLREVDFKDHTAELYDATGKMTKVRFSAEQEAELRLVANLYVTVTGLAEEAGPAGRDVITVSEIEARAQGDEFWSAPDIERIAAEQGIRPLGDESLEPAPFWPRGLDADKFLSDLKDDPVQSG